MLIVPAYARSAVRIRFPGDISEEVELPRPARVVRVAPLPIRSGRFAELRRIFGGEVQLTEMSLTEPSRVAAVATSISADAVLLDVVEPAALAALVDGLRGHTLLRPVLSSFRTSRGEQQPVFVGYGRLAADGHVEPLPDGTLFPAE